MSMEASTAVAAVSGAVSWQRSSALLCVDKARFVKRRCVATPPRLRQCRTCCTYQQDVEENVRRKAPSTPPNPGSTRVPPPPPPPSPSSSQSAQFSGQSRRGVLALVGICAVAYGFNITQHPEASPDSVTSVPAKSADVYANTALRPDRIWPSVTPENPFTQVIFWQKAPYARLRKDGWMRLYGMQSGRNGKVELIMEARGGNQYKLEVPLKQVKPWDMQFMNALFNSLSDWDTQLKPFEGKIRNKNLALQ